MGWKAERGPEEMACRGSINVQARSTAFTIVYHHSQCFPYALPANSDISRTPFNRIGKLQNKKEKIRNDKAGTKTHWEKFTVARPAFSFLFSFASEFGSGNSETHTVAWNWNGNHSNWIRGSRRGKQKGAITHPNGCKFISNVQSRSFSVQKCFHIVVSVILPVVDCLAEWVRCLDASMLAHCRLNC